VALGRALGMLVVNNLADAEGKWVTENVKLLTAPKLEIKPGPVPIPRYTALAIVGDALAFIEVSVRPTQTRTTR
jgi:hypothetical protein